MPGVVARLHVEFPLLTIIHGEASPLYDPTGRLQLKVCILIRARVVRLTIERSSQSRGFLAQDVARIPHLPHTLLQLDLVHSFTASLLGLIQRPRRIHQVVSLVVDGGEGELGRQAALAGAPV